MRVRAFTLIELIIALSVVIILTTVGVARYSTFIQQQDFLSGAQKITGCIQKGQQYAVTNTNSAIVTTPVVRYVTVTVEPGPNSGLVCTIEGYSALPANTVAAILAQASGGSGNILSKTSVDNMSITSGSNNFFKIIFGTLEHGTPIDMSTNGSTSALAAPTTLGFSSSFTLQSISDVKVTATASIGETGVPILLSSPTVQ